MNKPKIILDLCGGTGAWSRPYAKAGYNVINVTLPQYDVIDFAHQIIGDYPLATSKRKRYIANAMAFSPVPDITKSQLNKAGEILIAETKTDEEYKGAYEIMSKWRAAHAYPINTFQMTLRSKLRNGGYRDFIVAQRLKRMPTIINKLKRYPTMHPSTMGDIGGLRAILRSVSDVRKLAKSYKESDFRHKLLHEYDYITNPKKDGYRAIHFIYEYWSKAHSQQYNGLRLELQIRTKLQHLWATAVETMGMIVGQALKFRQGEKKWQDFFAVTSAAFALMEQMPSVPGYENKSSEEIYKAVVDSEKKLKVITQLRGLSLAAEHISQQDKKWHFHLIILDTSTKSLSVKSYARDQFSLATNEYAEYENKAVQGEPLDLVLVSAGPIESLRKAYPNYFLNTKEFIDAVEQIASLKKGV